MLQIIQNQHLKGETISKLIVHSHLMKNHFSWAKIKIFYMSEVWTGCAKLGHATLLMMHNNNKYIGPLIWVNELSKKAPKLNLKLRAADFI